MFPWTHAENYFLGMMAEGHVRTASPELVRDIRNNTYRVTSPRGIRTEIDLKEVNTLEGPQGKMYRIGKEFWTHEAIIEASQLEPLATEPVIEARQQIENWAAYIDQCYD